MISAQPNSNPSIKTFSTHVFDLPRMCPVSGNPQPGSQLFVWYRANLWFLEIETLGTYIDSFIGGKQVGTTFIRDMEQTIQQIATDCATSVGVTVIVHARLVIADDPTDRTRTRRYNVTVKGQPR